MGFAFTKIKVNIKILLRSPKTNVQQKNKIWVCYDLTRILKGPCQECLAGANVVYTEKKAVVLRF